MASVLLQVGDPINGRVVEGVHHRVIKLVVDPRDGGICDEIGVARRNEFRHDGNQYRFGVIGVLVRVAEIRSDVESFAVERAERTPRDRATITWSGTVSSCIRA